MTDLSFTFRCNGHKDLTLSKCLYLCIGRYEATIGTTITYQVHFLTFVGTDSELDFSASISI